jgi:hypothetical protein
MRIRNPEGMRPRTKTGIGRRIVWDERVGGAAARDDLRDRSEWGAKRSREEMGRKGYEERDDKEGEGRTSTHLFEPDYCGRKFVHACLKPAGEAVGCVS